MKETVLPVNYNDVNVGNIRSGLLLPNEHIIIEVKAMDSSLKLNHIPQLVRYLVIANYTIGYLVNYNQNVEKEL